MTPRPMYTVELRSLELEGTVKIRTIHDKKNLHFFFKSVGKHLKSVGGRRLKKSVDYRVNR
jgi:hypothetical protein